jgi:Tol biopolymer transport system component
MTQPTAIAHYRIICKLGQGGMGEVWRATDTKLNRDVAIKILPEIFAQDADRMSRFAREAQVLASLNHPNIAAIYGVEDRALIMELVEGPTLSELISGGPVPPDQVLSIAKQIAEAMEYAHERSIIHRDLKPANIKVTPEGQVKVLDFGLAKAMSTETTAGNPAPSPTLTMRSTEVGVIMGTAAYMAPEQASGKPVDRRADIWSFGAVVYEMLAGKRAFEGESVSETLANVLKVEPDWNALPCEIQAPISKLLARCLNKDRRQRLQAIGEARIALESPFAGEETARAGAPSQSWFGIIASGAAALFFTIAALLAFIHFREMPTPADLVRFQVLAPGRSDGITYPILSPNGRMIAFLTAEPSVRHGAVWVRSLDSLDARLLPGVENAAVHPFWSPDSRFLAFEQEGKLKKVGVSGGTPQTLCAVPGTWLGGAWSRQGVIVFGSTGHGLMQVPESGGTATPITALDPARQETLHVIGTASFLPDGRHFVYYRSSRVAENRGVYLASLDAKPGQQPSIPLAVTVASGLYVPSQDPTRGYLLFRREGALLAQPFDNRRLQLIGEPVLVAGDLPDSGPPPFSASETGVLTYRAFGYPPSQLTWVDRDGKKLGTVGELGQHYGMALSRDGTRAAVSQSTDSTANGNFDIWVHQFASGTRERLTSDPAIDTSPVWSPDDRRIAFSSIRSGVLDLYHKASNGVGNEGVLVKSDTAKHAYDWSSDGDFLLYGSGSAGHFDLWYLPLAGDDREPKPYLQTQFSQSQAQFSPDGHLVAYTSDESGRNEVYVRPFPRAASGKWAVSTNGGTQPRWRRDGKELFYVSADSKMMAVGVTTAPEFKKTGDPKALFTAPLLGGGVDIGPFRYDVSRDGRKFLIDAAPADGAASRPSTITIVLNWQTLVRK